MYGSTLVSFCTLVFEQVSKQANFMQSFLYYKQVKGVKPLTQYIVMARLWEVQHSAFCNSKFYGFILSLFLGAAAVGAWVVTELCSRVSGIVWLKSQVTRLARWPGEEIVSSLRVRLQLLRRFAPSFLGSSDHTAAHGQAVSRCQRYSSPAPSALACHRCSNQLSYLMREETVALSQPTKLNWLKILGLVHCAVTKFLSSKLNSWGNYFFQGVYIFNLLDRWFLIKYSCNLSLSDLSLVKNSTWNLIGRDSGKRTWLCLNKSDIEELRWRFSRNCLYWVFIV